MTLADLLDRVLDKGLVVQADVIISVAGIPLVGLNLRAALAGMETMIGHGLMRSWDERIRADAARVGAPASRRAPAGRHPAGAKRRFRDAVAAG